MKRKRFWQGVLLSMLLLTLVVGGLSAAMPPFTIGWWDTISGSTATGASYSVDSMMGQPLVGLSLGGSYDLCSGAGCDPAGSPPTTYPYQTFLPIIE